MSSSEARRVVTVDRGEGEWEGDFARPRIIVSPIAAPSILGLFGFSAATMMVAAWEAGWYGDPKSPGYLFPFAAVFGGLAQFLAGMWAYRARDGVATAMHGMWGSFWIAYGILQWLIVDGKLEAKTGEWPELGFWFTMLAAITLSGALASIAESLALFAVLITLATGSAFLSIGYWHGSTGWHHAAGWVLVISAALAWYLATAMMLMGAAGKVILPLGKLKPPEANKPGGKPVRPIQLEWGEPGVKKGQ